jgi:hypothetical protein
MLRYVMTKQDSGFQLRYMLAYMHAACLERERVSVVCIPSSGI